MNRGGQLTDHIADMLLELVRQLRAGDVKLVTFDTDAETHQLHVQKSQEWEEHTATGRITWTIQTLDVKRHRAYLNEALRRLDDEPKAEGAPVPTGGAPSHPGAAPRRA